MTELFHAFMLGAVQGLGEFLPISSSAHLILTPYLFGWKDQGLAFDVALHWGTLLAVVTYFRGEVWMLVKGFWYSLFKSTRELQANLYQKLSWLIILATIPAALVGKLLESRVESVFRNPLLVAGTLAGVGILLWIADRVGKKEKKLTEISWLNALVIGLSQAVSVIPGVSRSGSTMIAGLFQGLTRQDVAKFSFLMSIPIILGAGILKLPEIATIENTSALVVGFSSAAVFGFLAIKYMLRYIATRSFAVFTWYRLALAAVVIMVYYLR